MDVDLSSLERERVSSEIAANIATARKTTAEAANIEKESRWQAKILKGLSAGLVVFVSLWWYLEKLYIPTYDLKIAMVEAAEKSQEEAASAAQKKAARSEEEKSVLEKRTNQLSSDIAEKRNQIEIQELRLGKLVEQTDVAAKVKGDFERKGKASQEEIDGLKKLNEQLKNALAVSSLPQAPARPVQSCESLTQALYPSYTGERLQGAPAKIAEMVISDMTRLSTHNVDSIDSTEVDIVRKKFGVPQGENPLAQITKYIGSTETLFTDKGTRRLRNGDVKFLGYDSMRTEEIGLSGDSEVKLAPEYKVSFSNTRAHRAVLVLEFRNVVALRSACLTKL